MESQLTADIVESSESGAESDDSDKAVGRRSTVGQEWKKFLTRTGKARKLKVKGDNVMAVERLKLEEENRRLNREIEEDYAAEELNRKRVILAVEVSQGNHRGAKAGNQV